MKCLQGRLSFTIARHAHVTTHATPHVPVPQMSCPHGCRCARGVAVVVTVAEEERLQLALSDCLQQLLDSCWMLTFFLQSRSR